VILKAAADDKSDETTVKKEEILDKARSAYEAVVAIAKEARRLNAAPGVYLKGGDKPIPRAVRNFVDGRVEYEIEEDVPAGGKSPGRGKKRR
jgi:DNA-directed RNA polymerase subunit K/omega